ncbi:MAG: CocE/NonD family hydrolase [Alphaproteobacteria bacterium]|nr:CocE/NonD family hydrolase [Alphaproteobacteria bacterium]MBU1512865.1 CocE/NonD family hydrolase [Alphaproteobacteria bacterium]MBU2096694.1 CocE/NonD family hydrolase [Alphaproteobacteria bacterium]MBU2150577.1 CocE/NonD family hydrolase [Alphaproteobacteria bacterium]MBU2308075.1 CocE/NonD family hydrolase [Alphaproteobacteria bacterium]
MIHWRKLALASTAALILAGGGDPAFAQRKAATAAQQAAKPAPWPGLPPGASEEYMTLRDGARLGANVFKPQGKGPWPVVMARTPYIKDGRLDPEKDPGGAKNREALVNQAKRYTDAGYVYVVQDVRGKGRSQGFYTAFENDIEDGYDAVEWAGTQPWSNGKVGMTGGSALGITANSAALAAPPHLKAAYVVVAPADRLSYSYPGGVLKEKDTIGWLAGQGIPEETLNKTRGRSLDDVSWNRVAMTSNRKYIQIPIYNVGGWYDIFNGGTVDNFEYLQNQGAPGARGNQKLMMGPFGHGQLSGDLAYPGSDRLALGGDQELRWFEYWLKGQDNGIMDEPPVQYFMMAGAKKDAFSAKNRLLSSANWPLAYREVRYYPGRDNALSTKAPTADERKVSYKFDPADPVKTFGGANLTFERGPEDQRQVGQRQDYLRFQTPVLDKDVAIAGPVKVELYAATDGLDTDFVAKLVDVYPDGYEALVLDAPIRAKFRNGRLPEDIRMMTPGAPEKLTIDLWPTAITFEKGHRIALHITSSNSPRFEVNPNTGEAPAMGKLKPRVATNSIYMDQTHPTAIVLPVIYPNDLK